MLTVIAFDSYHKTQYSQSELTSTNVSEVLENLGP